MGIGITIAVRKTPQTDRSQGKSTVRGTSPFRSSELVRVTPLPLPHPILSHTQTQQVRYSFKRVPDIAKWLLDFYVFILKGSLLMAGSCTSCVARMGRLTIISKGESSVRRIIGNVSSPHSYKRGNERRDCSVANFKPNSRLNIPSIVYSWYAISKCLPWRQLLLTGNDYCLGDFRS